MVYKHLLHVHVYTYYAYANTCPSHTYLARITLAHVHCGLYNLRGSAQTPATANGWVTNLMKSSRTRIIIPHRLNYESKLQFAKTYLCVIDILEYRAHFLTTYVSYVCVLIIISALAISWFAFRTLVYSGIINQEGLIAAWNDHCSVQPTLCIWSSAAYASPVFTWIRGCASPYSCEIRGSLCENGDPHKIPIFTWQ